ncbi:hypothetical protein LLQ46_01960 [Rouxiella badensis]|uniref:hypothetical protein n=1 Tax=Rouxiella badensis TaxID=1646377 RepID=UPI001B7AD59C|nr:hypothetical protein [Rouxiella badensis]MCC3745608.1 hypothetical protein [Rouxiella badensis]
MALGITSAAQRNIQVTQQTDIDAKETPFEAPIFGKLDTKLTAPFITPKDVKSSPSSMKSNFVLRKPQQGNYKRQATPLLPLPLEPLPPPPPYSLVDPYPEPFNHSSSEDLSSASSYSTEGYNESFLNRLNDCVNSFVNLRGKIKLSNQDSNQNQNRLPKQSGDPLPVTASVTNRSRHESDDNTDSSSPTSSTSDSGSQNSMGVSENDTELNLIDNPLYSQSSTRRGPPPRNSYEKHIYAQIDERILPKTKNDFKHEIIFGKPLSNYALDRMFFSACGGGLSTPARVGKEKTAEDIAKASKNASIDASEALEAQKFIFDLYTGKQNCPQNPEIKKIIEEKSLNLFIIVKKHNEHINTPPENHWKIPPKLLFIAGFKPQEEGVLDHKPEIAETIYQSIEHLKNIVNNDETSNENTIFDNNRFITSVEIDAFSKKLTDDLGKTFSKTTLFHEARELPTDNATASQRLIELFDVNNRSTVKTHFVPLLLNEHWYLFGTFYDSTNTKQALMFDSMNGASDLENYERFKKLAKDCGAEGNILTISKDLQTFCPDACGLFVAKAMEVVSKQTSENYQNALLKMSDDFLQTLDEEQHMFNLRGRAELLSALSEAISR